jgi:hypothetical protein
MPRDSSIVRVLTLEEFWATFFPIKREEEAMSKALNITGGIAILWIILHGIWNIGNFEGFSGELQGAQLFEGIFALSVGIGLLVVFLKLKRK